MSDKFVKVMTFNDSFEAQLAKQLLKDEGIESMLTGMLTANVLFGNIALGDQIVLRVHEDEAQRAASILATNAAEAKLDDDWENQAEAGAGVWLCTICGEPIRNRLSICYSCQTPREGIRADAPRDLTAIQSEPSTLPTGEEVQKRDEITRTTSPVPPPPPRPQTIEREDEEEETIESNIRDNFARESFTWAFFGLVTVFLLPISWYYLVRMLSAPYELSPTGRRYLYGALLVNGIISLLVIAFCAGRIGWL